MMPTPSLQTDYPKCMIKYAFQPAICSKCGKEKCEFYREPAPSIKKTKKGKKE